MEIKKNLGSILVLLLIKISNKQAKILKCIKALINKLNSSL